MHRKNVRAIHFGFMMWPSMLLTYHLLIICSPVICRAAEKGNRALSKRGGRCFTRNHSACGSFSLRLTSDRCSLTSSSAPCFAHRRRCYGGAGGDASAEAEQRKAATDFHGGHRGPERGRRQAGNQERQELHRAGHAQPPPRRPNNKPAGLTCAPTRACASRHRTRAHAHPAHGTKSPGGTRGPALHHG
jgi:hypothetical protein